MTTQPRSTPSATPKSTTGGLHVHRVQVYLPYDLYAFVSQEARLMERSCSYVAWKLIALGAEAFTQSNQPSLTDIDV